MKKFLSLVLSLIMALSLVTISAGATEYADLTDVDEIQYEEAVAVLNRIGIITGYPDGSFKPTSELTRGAAAKIIVGLLIGPEAAENLTVAVAPYPDVPVTNTFAGVISYCKTAGIISGYSDGTFKPTAPLTGYAFSKMLLGAIGYRSDVEGFTGAGYTMNVARIGNAAGLFNRLSFNGGETVNREVACQLALNTLKATMVEYSGGFTVNAGDATVVGAQTRTYVASNQEYATHINNRRADNNAANNPGGDLYTVEFGEEHFKDLRMDEEGSARDAFGRPSTEWSYKLITIGTFPLEPDFVYTSKVAYRDDDSAAATRRALGMVGFSTDDDDNDTIADTNVYVNGELAYDGATHNISASWTPARGFDFTADPNDFNIEDIAAFTDNGTLVECYIDQDDADFIETVVVIKSELMEIKKIGSDYVTLQKYDDNGGADKPKNNLGAMPRYPGFNQPNLDTYINKVDNVEIDDVGYELLSGKKAGDLVVVIPVTEDGVNWEVGDVYVPETVSGALTKVETYGQTNDKSGDRTTVAVTVGGTKYPVSLWNKKLVDINADKIDVTRKDVTLTLDAYGNAMLAKNVGAGSGVEDDHHVGDLVRYTNSGTLTSTADWRIENQAGKVGFAQPRIYAVNSGYGDGEYGIKRNHTRVPLVAGYSGAGDDGDAGTADDVASAVNYFADGVKFVYVNFNDDKTEVESVQILTGVQDVDYNELIETGGGLCEHAAQAYLNGDGAVKAVVIKGGTGTLSSNVLYIRSREGSEEVINGKKIYEYRAAVVNGNDFDDDVHVFSDENLKQGDFATWAEAEFEGVNGTFYSMRKLDSQLKSTSSARATVVRVENANTSLLRVSRYRTNSDGQLLVTSRTNPTLTRINLALDYDDDDILVGNSADTLRVATKNWIDETGTRGWSFNSAKDLKDYMDEVNDGVADLDDQATFRLRFVFDDKLGDDAFRETRLVVVESIVDKGDDLVGNDYDDPGEGDLDDDNDDDNDGDDDLGIDPEFADNSDGLDLLDEGDITDDVSDALEELRNMILPTSKTSPPIGEDGTTGAFSGIDLGSSTGSVSYTVDDPAAGASAFSLTGVGRGVTLMEGAETTSLELTVYDDLNEAPMEGNFIFQLQASQEEATGDPAGFYEANFTYDNSWATDTLAAKIEDFSSTDTGATEAEGDPVVTTGLYTYKYYIQTGTGTDPDDDPYDVVEAASWKEAVEASAANEDATIYRIADTKTPSDITTAILDELKGAESEGAVAITNDGSSSGTDMTELFTAIDVTEGTDPAAYDDEDDPNYTIMTATFYEWKDAGEDTAAQAGIWVVVINEATYNGLTEDGAKVLKLTSLVFDIDADDDDGLDADDDTDT